MGARASLRASSRASGPEWVWQAAKARQQTEERKKENKRMKKNKRDAKVGIPDEARWQILPF
jgi:hypothetical protein